jgi:O-succinylbenzoate synthase
LRIERATLREIEAELRDPFRTSSGTIAKRRILLLTLEGEGLESWAECVAGADAASPETVDSAWSVLAGGLPRIVGHELTEPEELGDALPAPADARMARAVVEMAAWDMTARAQGVSLSKALGGAMESVPVGVAVGLQESDDALLEVIAAHSSEGYRRIKVKIMPGRDVAMLGAVRERFPTAVLWADANASYTLQDSSRLRRLDALELGLLEQPLPADDFAGHAQLQERIRTAICLDESIRSLEDATYALRIGACRVVNIKPGRVGGFAESIRIHDLLREAGLPMWCGGMLETGIGRAYNLALASLPGFTLAGDISATRRYWRHDIVDLDFDVADGCMQVPTGPGSGVAVDVERVRSLTVREAVFGPQR